jgi:hypothetical protein
VTRIVQLIMALTLVAGAFSAWWWYAQNAEAESAALRATQNALADLEQQVKYRAAVGDTVVNGRGWPITIDPAWWNGEPPINALATPGGPWLEVADKNDYELEHPRVRVILTREHAAFWYNPGNGLIRARVPQMVSDRKALETYNTINHTRVDELFDSSIRGQETVAAPVETD